MASNSRFQWIQNFTQREKMPEKDLSCLNCKMEYCGVYCPRCGQKSKTRRLTVTAVVKDFMDALSDSDKGFLRTVIDLSKNPGHMLRDYIAGKRQRYLSAGKYTFFLVVVFIVSLTVLEANFGWFEKLTQQLNTLEAVQTKDDNILLTTKDNADKMMKENKNAVRAQGVKKDLHFDFTYFGKKVDKEFSKKELLQFIQYLMPKYQKTLFDYLKFLVASWIPIFAFFSFIFFFKGPFNFAEHVTINSYIYAHILLVFIIFSPMYWLFPALSGTTLLTSVVASGFYLFFSYFQIFSQGSYRAAKITMCIFCASTSYLIVMSTFVSIMGIHVFVKNIDLL